MKKTILMISLLLLLTLSISYAVEVNVSVTINDQPLKTSAPNLLIDNRTYLVARDLTSALGGDINWHPDNRMVEIIYKEDVLNFFVDENKVLVNDEEYPLATKPFIRNGRTYIPLRFAAEFLDTEVQWNQDFYRVELTKPELKLKEEFIDQDHYTAEDVKWLSKIVQVESGDGSSEMKLAIANVVLNRVEDPRFPNTVKDVIFENNVHVQFPPAHKSSFESVQPTQRTLIATKNALEGKNNIDQALFFNNSPFSGKSDDLIKIIDGEYFYY